MGRDAMVTCDVLIVGGGPAGLEVARVAALRGHQVALYDRERRLGGQLRFASILRQENEALLGYLAGQMEKLGVRVELGQEVTAALIDREKPDVVVVATGATPVLPEIPGIERDNVFSGVDIQNMMQGRFNGDRAKGNHWQRLILLLGGRLMAAPLGLAAIRWLLRFWTPFGQRVVVVGKGLAGIEMAYFLVKLGKQVTIVDTRQELPYDEPPMPMLRRHLEEKLAKSNVPMITAAKYEQMTEQGLIITNKEGQTQNIEGDSIVFTGYYRPDTALSQTLPDRYKVHLIGDCAGPSGFLEAIHSGFRIGCAI